jgi:hypothetical protein
MDPREPLARRWLLKIQRQWEQSQHPAGPNPERGRECRGWARAAIDQAVLS